MFPIGKQTSCMQLEGMVELLLIEAAHYSMCCKSWKHASPI